jgi:hypothetical protein
LLPNPSYQPVYLPTRLGSTNQSLFPPYRVEQFNTPLKQTSTYSSYTYAPMTLPPQPVAPNSICNNGVSQSLPKPSTLHKLDSSVSGNWNREQELKYLATIGVVAFVSVAGLVWAARRGKALLTILKRGIEPPKKELPNISLKSSSEILKTPVHQQQLAYRIADETFPRLLELYNEQESNPNWAKRAEDVFNEAIRKHLDPKAWVKFKFLNTGFWGGGEFSPSFKQGIRIV